MRTIKTRRGLKRTLFSTTAAMLLLGAGLATTVWAATSNFWVAIETGSTPGTVNFTAPEHGFIASTAHYVWAAGVGSMYDTDVDADQELESWALRMYQGAIANPEGTGKWEMDVDYWGEVKAHANYVPTGTPPFILYEAYLVRADGLAEIYGDFSWAQEARVRVYRSFTGLGNGNYDVTGSDGTVHAGAGTELSKDNPITSGGTAVSTARLSFGDPQQTFVKNSWAVFFTLRARGYHRFNNKSEEDVSLSTLISPGYNQDGTIRGWKGEIRAYAVDPQGNETLIQTYPLA